VWWRASRKNLRGDMKTDNGMLGGVRWRSSCLIEKQRGEREREERDRESNRESNRERTRERETER